MQNKSCKSYIYIDYKMKKKKRKKERKGKGGNERQRISKQNLLNPILTGAKMPYPLDFFK